MTARIVHAQVRIPLTLEQGDSVTWIQYPLTDEEHQRYDSSSHTLRTTFAGATAPLVVTAAAEGSAWRTSLSTAQTTAMQPGRYWWQMQLIAASFSLTVARGDIAITRNLANAAAGYSGLTEAEQALAAAKEKLNAAMSGRGQAVGMYTIATRTFHYRTIDELIKAISYLQTVVNNERPSTSIAQGQGNPRKLYTRFPAGGRW